MSARLRILSIGAHPADIFDQCGGTLAHHAARGDSVCGVSLTAGARIDDAVISDQMQRAAQVPQGAALANLMAQRGDIKAGEVRKACEILGFDELYFLGVDDAVLLVNDQTIRLVARLLRKLKPDVVLTHYPRERDGMSWYHAIAGQIVLHAIQFADMVDPEDPTPLHRVAQVFFWGQGAAGVRRSLWDSQGSFSNDVFVDITDVIDKKFAAMECLTSQGYTGTYNKKRLETSDGAFGVGAGVAYAEGFISMNAQTYSYLPVSEHTLAQAHSSDHEIMARYSKRLNVDGDRVQPLS